MTPSNPVPEKFPAGFSFEKSSYFKQDANNFFPVHDVGKVK